MDEEKQARWPGRLGRGHRHRGQKQHAVSKECWAQRTRQRGEGEKNFDVILWTKPLKDFKQRSTLVRSVL